MKRKFENWVTVKKKLQCCVQHRDQKMKICKRHERKQKCLINSNQNSRRMGEKKQRGIWMA